MRLFLASENFGNHEKELLELVGLGRRALVITSARDYYSPERRLAKVSEKLAVFRKAGFEAEELSLKDYFGRHDALAKHIRAYRPDLVFAIGGSVFLLAVAYKLSGFDRIVLDALKNDEYVYGGYSAGAMIVGRTMKYYGHGHLNPGQAQEIYGVEAVFDGLGLIDQFIVAHADVPEHIETTKLYVDRLKNGGEEVILLNQSAVLMVDGEKRTLLP